jgi:hypothetical protein
MFFRTPIKGQKWCYDVLEPSVKGIKMLSTILTHQFKVPKSENLPTLVQSFKFMAKI